MWLLLARHPQIGLGGASIFGSIGLGLNGSSGTPNNTENNFHQKSIPFCSMIINTKSFTPGTAQYSRPSDLHISHSLQGFHSDLAHTTFVTSCTHVLSNNNQKDFRTHGTQESLQIMQNSRQFHVFIPLGVVLVASNNPLAAEAIPSYPEHQEITCSHISFLHNTKIHPPGTCTDQHPNSD